MLLVELLDKIDDTAPRDCRTCVHMATHEKCKGCLYSQEELDAYHAAGRPSGGLPNMYHHWEPGNWLRNLHEWQRTGRASIVIGGCGEAEVRVGQSIEEANENLNYVACECGYMYGSLVVKGSTTSKNYVVDGRTFRIVWEEGELDRIEQHKEGEGYLPWWSRHEIIEH